MKRFSSSSSVLSLKERITQTIPQHQQKIKNLTSQYGSFELGKVNVSQAIGGMRDIPCMLYETSLLDAQEGIRFRGYSIPELQAKLPSARGGSEPLPEGLLWLLLTGDIPNDSQVQSVSRELFSRSEIPRDVMNMIDSYPKNMHPMTQLSSAVLALQPYSKFAQAYQRGENKKTFWTYTYEDSMDLIAKLPQVAARIFRNTFFDGQGHLEPLENLDYGANFARMLGASSAAHFTELVRLYLVIHSDHEGGNVSAHTTHLVGSALSDPYLSFSAGLNGLAGPLHGLANQEVLRWIMNFRQKYGENMSKDTLVAALWDTLNAGQVIPGYGHAVLRKTDPRFTCQKEFAMKHMPDDPLVKLVSDMYDVVPGILTKHGKTKNPWPNVDAHSGVLLRHYGLTQESFYTVLFGVSRALGVLADQVIARYLGLPIERPKSLDSDSILAEISAAKVKN